MRREAEKKGKKGKVKKQNHKLRNKDTFGKLKENLINKADIKIATARKQHLKWSLRPTFKRKNQFCNGAKTTKKKKSEYLRKP